MKERDADLRCHARFISLNYGSSPHNLPPPIPHPSCSSLAPQLLLVSLVTVQLGLSLQYTFCIYHFHRVCSTLGNEHLVFDFFLFIFFCFSFLRGEHEGVEP